MKKLLISFSLLFLMSFTPSTDATFTVTNTTNNHVVLCKIINLDGMRYAVFYKDHSYSSPFTVNLTKDKLECEYYKRQMMK